jgi:hypothetical protein
MGERELLDAIRVADGDEWINLVCQHYWTYQRAKEQA